jgi:ParB/RepB/Spo0J family partition protein
LDNYATIECHLIAVDTEKRRPIDEATAIELARSIREDGLLHPITVRPNEGRYWLIAGAHRLKAWYEILRRPTILAKVLDLDDNEAEIIEIEENLRRLDLTREQRDDHIRRFAELEKLRHADPLSDKGGRGRVGLATHVAGKLGMQKKTVQRALKQGYCYLPPKKKEPPKEPEPATASEVMEGGIKMIKANWSDVSERERIRVKHIIAELPGGVGELESLSDVPWETA